MARADHIAKLGICAYGGLYGGDAVLRRHTCAYTVFGFNRHGKRGAEAAVVVGHHRRQGEGIGNGIAQAQAHDAAAIAYHLRHHAHAYGVGGDDQIGFVFTVVVVEQNHGYACLYRGDGAGKGWR